MYTVTIKFRRYRLLRVLTNSYIFPGHADRIGIEFILPIKQDKNGLQMETYYQFILGYQKSF